MRDDAARRELRRAFDEDALAYDRTRPVLPEAAFDDLLAAADLHAGSRVLEIGCGTGQATVPMARRGLRVTAIELGPELAALARAKVASFDGVEVVTSSFEDWQHDGEAFDAVVAVNALHWIDAELRYAKPASVLRGGGAMVVGSCRWATPEQPDPFLSAVEDDYEAVGYPGDPPPPADDIETWHFPLEATPFFAETATLRYQFSMTLSAPDYVANLRTQATTYQLGAERAEKFLRRVSHRLAAMDRHDVTRHLVGLLTVGRRRS